MRTKLPLMLSVVVCNLASVAVYVQAASESQDFEVASVKPSKIGGQFAMNDDPGRIDYRQFGIKTLIWVAFQVPLPRIVWPVWMSNHDGGIYDISATFPRGTTREQQYVMLQNLLADRFKLASHREMQDGKVYALVVSNRGLKIRKAKNPPADDVLSIGVKLGKDGFHLDDKLADSPKTAPHGIRISQLVRYFNNGLLDHVMVDKTGLEGYFEVNLFVPPEVDAGVSVAADTKVPVMPSASTLFDALEKQLGLKVKTETAPVEMLVIDHLERTPTSN